MDEIQSLLPTLVELYLYTDGHPESVEDAKYFTTSNYKLTEFFPPLKQLST